MEILDNENRNFRPQSIYIFHQINVEGSEQSQLTAWQYTAISSRGGYTRLVSQLLKILAAKSCNQSNFQNLILLSKKDAEFLVEFLPVQDFALDIDT